VQADVFRGPYSSQRYDPLGIIILDLGSNQIHTLSPYSFEHLPNLTELRLNNNPLKVLGPSTLMALGSPENLKVSEQQGTCAECHGIIVWQRCVIFSDMAVVLVLFLYLAFNHNIF
jgi:hypothetical protein